MGSWGSPVASALRPGTSMWGGSVVQPQRQQTQKRADPYTVQTQRQVVSAAPQFGGMPGPAPIPQVAAPTPLTINASRDANISETYGDARRFAQDLGAGTDRDAVNAMMRQRDVISGLAKEVGQERALATGGEGSGAAQQAKTDVFTSGGRDLSNLNASLAAGSRSAQLAALGVQGGTASAGASAMNASNQFALSTWEAAQRKAEQEAAAVNAANQTAWNNQLLLSSLYTG